MRRFIPLVFAINVFKAREVLDLSHITRVPTAPEGAN